MPIKDCTCETEAAYAQYFDWKKNYEVWTKRAFTEGFCELCKHLHTSDERKEYDNLDTWWDKEGSCDLQMPVKMRETYLN